MPNESQTREVRLVSFERAGRNKNDGRLARRGSVRTQVIVWNIVTLAIWLGALGIAIRYTVRSFLMSSVERELEHRVQPPPDHGRPPPGLQENGPHGSRPSDGPDQHGNHGRGDGRPRRDGDPPRGEGPPPPQRERDPYAPRFFDLKGKSRDRNVVAPAWDSDAVLLAATGKRTESDIEINDEPLRVLTSPMIQDGHVFGVVQAAYRLTEVYQVLAGLDAALLTLIPVGLLCAGLAGAALTGRVLKRVRDMTTSAGEIGTSEFSERLPVSGNDEFSELAVTFNGLLGRLESSFTQQKRLLEQQRRFTADASHELKTPLTIIKGTTSMALSGSPDVAECRDSLQEIDAAADSMSQLVQDLLLLAKSDGGQLGVNRIELLAREAFERAAASFRCKEFAPIILRIENESQTLIGNENELVRLFTNLFDNALRHTPPEGTITLGCWSEELLTRISITDTGCGIAPEHLSHLGERFYRADASRSRPSGGTGLGLSICKSIVEAHEGAIRFESEEGVGTTVHLSFPHLPGEAA